MDDHREEKTTQSGIREILSVYEQLRSLGVTDERMLLQNLDWSRFDARVIFLRELAELQHETGVYGAVAECGVFRGYFASYINEYYPDRTLYLFDSFEGFEQSAIEAENAWIKEEGIVSWTRGDERLSLLRCPNRVRTVVKRGWIPGSFSGLEDERFAFVNLDMDLYDAQLNALRFFAPRMSKGGVILLHDYYYPALPGVKLAVNEFSKERDFIRLPIGDGLSMAIIMKEG
jgi:hypothetical protein